MRKLGMIFILTVAFAAIARADYQGPLTVNIYSHYTSYNGDGEPYSGLVGTFLTPDIMFGKDNHWHWHPFALRTFAADITGTFDAPTTGTYKFALLADDGAQLFIDGGLTVDDGGAHPPTFASGTIFLTAGDHPLDVKFFECCGGRSGVNLYLPGTTPEPPTLLLLLMGLTAVGIVRVGTAGHRTLNRKTVMKLR